MKRLNLSLLIGALLFCLFAGCSAPEEEGKGQSSAEGVMPKHRKSDEFESFDSIQGKVLSQATGAPIKGAEIALVTVHGIRLGITETDEKGVYDIALPEKPIQHLLASHRDYMSSSHLMPKSTGEAGRMVFKLESRVGIARRECPKVEGLTVQGRIMSERGKPIPGALVIASPYSQGFRIMKVEKAGGHLVHEQDPRAVSDKKGIYSFQNLKPGQIQLSVRCEEYGFRQSIPFKALAHEKITVDFTLVQGGEISGIIKDESGKPVEGANVLAVTFSLLEDVKRVRTDNHGVFRIAGLRKLETYSISAKKKGYRRSKSVFSKPGESVSLIMRVSSSIEGIVLDATTAKPIFQADVRWIRGSRQILPIPTRKDGSFNFTGMAPGTYRIRVEAKGYAQVEKEIVLGEGERIAGMKFLLRHD
jgi:protocatechuate 3,4-dioxygenase beta subunit